MAETSPCANRPIEPTDTEVELATLRDLKGISERFSALTPLVLGLAVARVGLLAASYASYSRTDDGLLTDGASLIALCLVGVLLAIVAGRRKPLRKRVVNRLMDASIALEALTGAALGGLMVADLHSPVLQIALSALCMLGASLSMFYWLRRARGTNTVVAAAFVFTALAASEVMLGAVSLLPDGIDTVLAAALVLVQYPLRLLARKKVIPRDISGTARPGDFFSFSASALERNRFLIATAVGIGALSIVIGFLRGYPAGEPIPFTPVTRLTYALLVIGVCACVIVALLRGGDRAATVGIFIAMELLAGAALILYAAFPDSLHIGAVASTTLNALMVGFTWYISLAFMSAGARDPYYYSSAGWIVWLGCRALTRVSLIALAPAQLSEALVLTVVGGVLLVSTQVVLVQFLDVSARAARADQERHAGNCEACAAEARASALERLMGLDSAAAVETPEQVMHRRAAAMGAQFLLSEREVEVLELYAQGYTQKRVADELGISQGTAHAHVKRIYAKTDLHSRQELIDYLEEFTV
ncbi:helix-turn-helix transcriptional regulator [Berryella wangjianweii]|uniref:Helix-turn-helix transcriptional regulator n=1 Tax=Berryella wangjianweii TaxID=2734634 RepID=A0A6M8J3B3_9ACTN|nr:helix-turn-helix transcriptional regulator [Berryella wangjianweii]QKF07631.1 helix-turn-helix transcriptional regulator [Berryella wangjianweii]